MSKTEKNIERAKFWVNMLIRSVLLIDTSTDPIKYVILSNYCSDRLKVANSKLSLYQKQDVLEYKSQVLSGYTGSLERI